LGVGKLRHDLAPCVGEPRPSWPSYHPKPRGPGPDGAAAERRRCDGIHSVCWQSQVDKQIISVLSRGPHDHGMTGAIGRSGETMPRLNTLGARVTTLDTRTVKPQPKQTDPHYLSPQHRAWRKVVCDRAGWRCEWIDERGQRCAKAAPRHRMFADHKKERQDAPDAEFSCIAI
jgi:hypothetical protein